MDRTTKDKPQDLRIGLGVHSDNRVGKIFLTGVNGKKKRRQVALGIGGHKGATWSPLGGSYIAEGKLKVPTSPEDVMYVICPSNDSDKFVRN
jgi:hypothetical protein